MSWGDVCKTKEEGGIGIRRLEDVAKAINITPVWKYLRDNLRIKCLKNKYCKNMKFWIIHLDNNASHT